MNISPIATEILNLLGGQKAINNLMSPKMITVGDNEVGVRLKRANKDKINHIHITKTDNTFKVDFWSFPESILDHNLVSSCEDVQPEQIKVIISSHTDFAFPKCDSEENERISGIILALLGGTGTLNAMLGLKKVKVIDHGVFLAFKIIGADGINGFSITHDKKDTYKIKYFKNANIKAVEVDEITDVYAGSLVHVIEKRLQCALVIPVIAHAKIVAI